MILESSIRKISIKYEVSFLCVSKKNPEKLTKPTQPSMTSAHHALSDEPLFIPPQPPCVGQDARILL